METDLNRTQSSHEGYQNKSLRRGHRSVLTLADGELDNERWQNNYYQNYRNKQKKPVAGTTQYKNESTWILRASLLLIVVIVLIYRSIFYGLSEYSLLPNGRIVHGYYHRRKSIVTLSIGYSTYFAYVAAAAACMLLYSLFSRKPQWSLPTILVHMMDVVCDASNAIIASWQFYRHLSMGYAICYTAITFLVILGEFWMILGVLRLYEHRTST